MAARCEIFSRNQKVLNPALIQKQHEVHVPTWITKPINKELVPEHTMIDRGPNQFPRGRIEKKSVTPHLIRVPKPPQSFPIIVNETKIITTTPDPLVTSHILPLVDITTTTPEPPALSLSEELAKLELVLVKIRLIETAVVSRISELRLLSVTQTGPPPREEESMWF